MTFKDWLTANQKYIEPADLHAWLEEAFNAGRKAALQQAADLLANHTLGLRYDCVYALENLLKEIDQ